MDTCYNCGRRGNLTLVWTRSGTFRRCPDQAACVKRVGPCLKCGRASDQHRFAAIPGGNGTMFPIDHDFTRDPKLQDKIDAAYLARALEAERYRQENDKKEDAR